MPVRPLLARPGARYRCFGDGLCCSDIHAIGPVAASEKRHLELIAPGHVRRHPDIGADVVESRDGGCVHLGSDGCRIHAAHGAYAKPAVCRRFPYRLTATPEGGRVFTEHRCPCRTLGDRPPLDLDDAARSLANREGARLSIDLRVDRVPLARRRRVAFSTWRTIEAPILERLLSGDDPVGVLEAEPFGALEGLTWMDVAHLYRAKLDGSACGDALAWFGDVLMTLQGERLRPLRQRPWAPSFARAEARSTAIADAPEAIFGDWLADEVWGLEWTQRGSFERARRDLVTRYTVGREIHRRLVGEGVRTDRAAAEAVCIVELAGAPALWRGIVAALR